MKFKSLTIPLCFFLSLNSFSQISCFNSDFEDASLFSLVPGTITIASPNALNGWTVTSGVNSGTITSCNLNSCCPSPPNNVQIIGTTSTAGYIDPNIGSSYPIFSVYGAYTNSTMRLEDIHGKNVLKGSDGEFYYIDTQVFLESETEYNPR